MAKKYNFKKIEVKWQEIWEKSNVGKARDFDQKPKHYNLIEFPYPSGSGLHVGHCMGFGASDAYCRMKRMQGYNVLFPVGWDAFGLPTENYAIKTGVHPRLATEQNIANFRRQMKSLGFAFDYDREVDTTDPDYYKWTQWIFLQFYKHAVVDGKLVKVADDDTTTPRLAYQAEMPINWCPSCKIGLANEEVINGKCERCGETTEKRMQKQWMLRITAYADRLIDDLNTVDYLPKIKTQQTNWIGRSTGTNVKFEIRMSKSETNTNEKQPNQKEYIEVFTTRADTLFGCTYLVLSPEHSLIKNLGYHIQNFEEVQKYISSAKKKSDLERTELQKEKTGVKLFGIYAINPINNEEIDIYVADYVLTNYGTGAVMAVPAHDERDFEFAKKYKIPIKWVIKPSTTSDMAITQKIDDTGTDKVVGDAVAYFSKSEPVNDGFNRKIDRISYGISESAYTRKGTLFNSAVFNGLTSEQAITKITEKLKELVAGDYAVNYKLRDWIFSRQHYWGEPIPIIHCSKCGTLPVAENQLPIKLPNVERYEPTDTGESPLATISDWVNIKCPICGGNAKRETDTMPNWAGSSWYFLAYAMKNIKNKKSNIKNIFESDKAEIKYWMPVDLYNGGMEHTTLHLLYSRFWHKFLYDMKVVPTSEPYAKRIAHGIILGTDNQKMSKSKGNVINPDDIAKEYGADSLRAYVMFIGPYDQESAWNMNGIAGVYRFLNRVWHNANKAKNIEIDEDLLVPLNKLIKKCTEDIENYSLNTYIAGLMEFNNLLSQKDKISKNLLKIYLQLLSPACPHIAEELWKETEGTESIFLSAWPKYDEKYLIENKIEIVIQINGKVRQKLSVHCDITDDKLRLLAMEDAKIKELISNKEIKKVIVVPKKLVSIVL